MIQELLEKLYLPYVGKNPNLEIPNELENDYKNSLKKNMNVQEMLHVHIQKSYF